MARSGRSRSYARCSSAKADIHKEYDQQLLEKELHIVQAKANVKLTKEVTVTQT